MIAALAAGILINVDRYNAFLLRSRLRVMKVPRVCVCVCVCLRRAREERDESEGDQSGRNGGDVDADVD